MPRIQVPGAELHYEDQGTGPETIVFAHGLLMSGRMFDDQVEALRDRYRCVIFDFRGHGRSEITKDGYDMDTLSGDVIALIEALGCAPCHFVGLSMGGFVGLRLGIRHSQTLRSLILLDTSADPESPGAAARYRRLGFVARWLGFGLVVDRVLPVMFGPTFLNDRARADLRREWRKRLLSNDRVGVTRALRGVMNREGVHEKLDRITVPTLVVVGEEDVATPPEKAERIRDGIVGSKLVVVPESGHTSTVEAPEAVSTAIASFLASVG